MTKLTVQRGNTVGKGLKYVAKNGLKNDQPEVMRQSERVRTTTLKAHGNRKWSNMEKKSISKIQRKKWARKEKVFHLKFRFVLLIYNGFYNKIKKNRSACFLFARNSIFVQTLLIATRTSPCISYSSPLPFVIILHSN